MRKWALIALFSIAVPAVYLARRLSRGRAETSGTSSPESTESFLGSPSGSSTPRPIGPPPKLEWPLWRAARGDLVYAPGESHVLAVWCEAEDPDFVYCVPIMKDGDGKLLFRKKEKKTLTYAGKVRSYNSYN